MGVPLRAVAPFFAGVPPITSVYTSTWVVVGGLPNIRPDSGDWVWPQDLFASTLTAAQRSVRYMGIQSTGEIYLRFNAVSGADTGQELKPAVESSIRITITHITTGTTVTLIGLGSDTSEPYAWTPSNSSELIAVRNAINDATNRSVRVDVSYTP